MATRTRPTTTGELVTAFAGSLSTLSFNCDQFSEQIDDVMAERASAEGGPPLAAPVYDLSPIGEIAARLRKLLLPSRGDDLFRRVCAATGIAVPSVDVSGDATLVKVPWNRVVVEQFATGALPTDNGSGAPQPITDIGGRSCLAVVEPGERPVSFTWGDLVKQVGDKDGVHTDADRPLVWDFINQFHLGGVPAIPLLLYRLAVAVVEAGNTVLETAGANSVPVSPAHPAASAARAAVISETRKRPGPRPRRNDRCPCESGMKFKRCCSP